MAFYELTYIIRPDVPTTHVDSLLNKITDVVKKNKGKVVKSEQWGLRTLAYPIKKHKKGYYTYVGLSMPGEGLTDTEHQLKLSDDIIRFMTVKVEDLGKEPTAMMKAKNRAAAEGDDAEANA